MLPLGIVSLDIQKHVTTRVSRDATYASPQRINSLVISHTNESQEKFRTACGICHINYRLCNMNRDQ